MPFEQHNEDAQDAIVTLMKQRLSGFETEQGRLRGLSYVPQREGEVVITTTPKAGTTWMQQVRARRASKCLVCKYASRRTNPSAPQRERVCFLHSTAVLVNLDLSSTSIGTRGWRHVL